MWIMYTVLLLVMFISFSMAVKIVLSNTATTTTTTTTALTTTESVSNAHDTTEDSENLLINTGTSTFLLSTVTENVWPEFPPKKATDKHAATSTTPTTTTQSQPTEVAENKSDTRDLAKEGSSEKHSSAYCFCDLRLDECDINCCCDPNCHPMVFKSFVCSQDPLFENTYKGRYVDFTLHQGLPACEQENSWLCVFWSNARKHKQRETVKAVYYDTSQYYTWPNILEEKSGEEAHDFFKYGDPLQIININTRYVGNFDLPSNFESPYCQHQEPLRHLVPFKRSCIMALYEELIELQESLINFNQSKKILSKPEANNNLKNFTADTAEVRIVVCNVTLDACVPNTKQMREKGNLKHVLLSKINIKILHNFTYISGFVIEMWYKNAGFDENDSPTSDLWLNIEVDFYNRTMEEVLYNGFKKKTKIISGPLGYLTDQPVIVAKYMPYTLSLPLAPDNRVLNYFHESAATLPNTLAVLRRHNGWCHRDKKPQSLLHFGINVMISCKMRLSDDILRYKEPGKMNFSSLCMHLKEQAQYQLIGSDLNQEEDLDNYFVSVLGKPRNQSSNWLPLQLNNFDFNPAVGQYNEQTNSFICHNIQLSLSYEFYMATEHIDGIPYQNTIKRAAIAMGQRHDLEFSLDENIEVPLVTTIRFYDTNALAASKGSNIKNWFNAIFVIIIFV
uniref:DUF1619 domain-containing protein n=1 Tax=Glossina pallidipes TaxID=7398 RepID=A0A1A9Z4D3_GLOPL